MNDYSSYQTNQEYQHEKSFSAINGKSKYLAIAAIVILAIIFIAYTKRASLFHSNPGNQSSTPATVSPTGSSMENSTTQPASGLASLPIEIPIQSTDTSTLFNTLRPTDKAIFIFEGFSSAPLESVTQGRIAYAYGSGDDLQTALPTIPKTVTIVFYNPEHGSHTPQSEKDDLVNTVNKASVAVHASGRSFELVPDAVFSQQYAAQLAPYADVYIIQAQKYQGNLAQFDNFVQQTTEIVKKANPKCLIYVQIQVATQRGTTPTYSPQGAMRALQSLTTLPDGIDIWTFRREVSAAQDFLTLLRPNR